MNQTMRGDDMQGLIGLEVAAKRLALSVRAVHRLIARGHLRPLRIPGVRRTLLREADIARLVAGRGVTSAPAATRTTR